MVMGGSGSYAPASLSPSVASRRAPMVVPLAAFLASVMVLLVTASAGGKGVVFEGVVDGPVMSGGAEGVRVRRTGLQWHTYSFLSVSSMTPGKMGTTTMYQDLVDLQWNTGDGEGRAERLFRRPEINKVQCFRLYAARSGCVRQLPGEATSHVGTSEDARGAQRPSGLTMDITPAYLGRYNPASQRVLMRDRLQGWATRGTLFIVGLRDPITAYVSRFSHFKRDSSGDKTIDEWLEMELACESMGDTPDLASIAISAYAQEKGVLGDAVLQAGDAWAEHINTACDPHLFNKLTLWMLYIHNYAHTVYLMQGLLGGLASGDNVLVYQMEAWAEAREVFMRRMVAMMFGAAFAESHPFFIPAVDVVQNSGQDDPQRGREDPQVQNLLFSDTSKCRLARFHQKSTSAMVKMVHDLEARGAVQTFLPGDFVYGVYPDWWGGLEAKYCPTPPLH